MRIIRFSSLCAALSLMAMTACASGSAMEDGDAEPAAGAASAEITIQNNRSGVGAINVFLVPEAGTQAPLGSVESQGTGTFSRSIQPGFYTIRAQRTDGGADILSQRFSIRNGQRVTWNMQLNSPPTVTNR